MKEGGGTMDTVALETSPVTFAASPRKGLRAADERCVCKLGGGINRTTPLKRMVQPVSSATEDAEVGGARMLSTITHK